ncbi:N-acetylmuramoyl-L-alanine amidase [Dehalobacter sp. DCM]|uniref:N-acetylmuramoyl-L-alanine amidase family protein n=1 Tax=Dehalobacter sp. DCM TaxID=2907827 RepID=UPI00308191B1|nr:N-acetylmuramoyl-L-alanine amidase [Dehalobacter sp. DCM]
MRIVLNAGHGAKSDGSYDPGAVGPVLTIDGKKVQVKEAWQNKEVANKVKVILEKSGHTVLLIQDGDLVDIIKAANFFDADFFVSIHCNAAADPSAHGVETYAYCKGGKGEKLAQSIQSELVKATGLTDRGVKYANFFVLRKTDAPAVLVEMAFVTNPTEERLMMSGEGDTMFANAIAQGILKGMK